MTAAYAFTDYRLQGQTIPAVIVDIATLPTGALLLLSLDQGIYKHCEQAG